MSSKEEKEDEEKEDEEDDEEEDDVDKVCTHKLLALAHFNNEFAGGVIDILFPFFVFVIFKNTRDL